jgi:phosphatidylinositol glycan class W
LAVDFPVFPRGFGKTETFGTSLMDVGVGVFIVSSAITSKYARGAVVPSQRSSSSWFPSYQRFLVKLLGFGRLLVIKALGYQEHVSEYGVHWNFFMTLFTVWTVADLLHRYCSSSSLGVTTSNPSNNSKAINNSSAGYSPPVPLPLPFPPFLILSIVLLSVYQFFLTSSSSLTTFLLSNDPLLRTTTNTVAGLLSANKEGVFSLCGYLPLYLSSEWLASVLFFSRGNNSSRHDHQSDDDEKEDKDKEEDVDKPGGHTSNSSNPLVSCIKSVLSSQSFRVVCRLFQVSFFLWSFWWFSSHFIQATSRRLCNLSYVSLVLALSFSLLFSLALAERIILLLVVPSLPSAPSSSSPPLSSQSSSSSSSSGLSSLYFMNKHSILVFLAANLLTGAVNLTVPTIHTTNGAAVIVLSTYSFLVTASAWLAEYLLH